MEQEQQKKSLRRYWLFVLLGTLAVSGYPIYMGFRVIHDMTVYGTVGSYAGTCIASGRGFCLTESRELCWRRWICLLLYWPEESADWRATV